MPRTPLLRVALALALCALLPAAVVSPIRATPAVADGGVQVSVLPNGLRVATRERPNAETVSIAVAVRAGGRDEPPSLRGGSHLLEHIQFLGTPRYPTEEVLFSTVSAVGGDFNAGTGNETTTYFVTVPAARFALALDVLAEMLQNSTFPEEAVERERGVVQEELRGGRRTSLSIALDTFGRRLIGPAAQSAAGTIASVGAIELPELLAYRAQYYTAPNIVVGVAGSVRHAEALAAVGAAFAALPATAPPRPAPLPPPAENLRLEGESPFASLVMVGQRIPGVDSPDAAALLVLDAILDTPGTRMPDAFEAVGATVEGGTRIVLHSDVGLWAAFAYARPALAEGVADVVREEIRRLQEERVPDAEVQAATRYLAGRTLLNGESTASQAISLASLTALDVYESEEENAARINAVTAADVQRVARAYLNPDTFSILAQR